MVIFILSLVVLLSQAYAQAPPIRIEAESMRLTRYAVQSLGGASGGLGVTSQNAPGSPPREAELTWQDAAGTYDLSIWHYDESDGQSTFAILVNGQERGRWVADKDLPSSNAGGRTYTSHQIPGLVLVAGDTVTLQATEHQGEYARVDLLEFMPTGLPVPDVYTENRQPAWDFNQADQDQIEGFRLYWGATAGGPYTETIQLKDPTMRRTDILMPIGTWYMVATAYKGMVESPHSNEVTITIAESVTNQRPQVSIAPVTPVQLPQTLALRGTVTDDGMPAPGTLTLLWRMISGPAPLAFTAETSAVTEATATVAGTYVVSLTVSDSLLSAEARVTVIVEDPTVPQPPPPPPPPDTGMRAKEMRLRIVPGPDGEPMIEAIPVAP